MIRLECDYACGAHPAVLDKLVATNGEHTPGYGVDEHCRHAADLLRELCQAPEAAVHFLVGGTQTNTTVIDAALRPYQGVISAHTGHIATHETGAIEATGHKVLTIPSEDGKITAQQIDDLCRAHYQDPTAEHTVQPGMIYISNPTELGTIYRLEELEAIRAVADRYDIPLFLDGARLGCALAAPENDVTLPDLARLCDAFYVGGTKMGALFGEALVITRPALQRDFRYLIKQHGGMFAKGRLLGVQFEALLEDGLYFRIGEHSVSLAMQLKAAFAAKGYPTLVDSPTNQQFPILPNTLLEKLAPICTWSLQEKPDSDHTAIRFCTSWATTQGEIDTIIAAL